MKILNLKLLNFRNYEKLEINFNEEKNIIIGKNGMGKTNIVEAIYVLAFTKSFRGTREDIIIKNNTDLARIEGIVKSNYEDNYKIIIKSGEKKLKINNNNVNKISDYISKINVILFNSEDLKLIKDTPNTRRKLINIELSQLSNEYLKLMNYYNKVLKQRNAYLKTLYINGNASYEYLDILTNHLIDLGLKIFKYRSDFINKINKYLKNNFKNITNNDNLYLVYKSDFESKSKEELLKIYKKNKNKDITFGKTHIGIHRDDYEFLLNGLDLKDYGSEGEQKNSIIALKMSEIDIFKNEYNIEPILILDDLFSELDEEKINNIFKFIDKDIQTFITTTELSKINKNLLKNSKIFQVENNTVIEKEN